MSDVTSRNTVNSVKAASSVLPQSSPSLIARSTPSLSPGVESSSSSNNNFTDSQSSSSSSVELEASAPTHAQIFPSSHNYNELIARVELLENLLSEKEEKLRTLSSNTQHQQHVSPPSTSPTHVAFSSSATALFNSAVNKNKLLKEFTSHLSSPHFNIRQNSKNDDEEKYHDVIDINEELRKEREIQNKTKVKNDYTSSHSPDSEFSSSSDEDVSCRKCGEYVDLIDSNICYSCINKKKKKKLLKQQINELKLKYNSSLSPSLSIPPLENSPSSINIKNQFKNIDDTVYKAALSAVKNEKHSKQSDVEKKDADDSVLGAVIGELFNASQYQTLRLCRAPTAYTSSQLEKAVTDTINRLGKFGGDINIAPTWLNSFCTNVYRYRFEVHHCITILQQCFINEAKSWLDANLPLVSHLAADNSSVKPIEAILLKFKNIYMGPTQIRNFRRKLQTSKLTGANVTVRELKKHYEIFVGLVNNIRLCDITASEDYIIQEFVDSLPSRVTDFIGMSYTNCKSLDSIYQMAEIALTKHSEYYQTKSDGGLKNKSESLNYIEVGDKQYVEVNALQSKYKNKNNNSNNNNNSSTQQPMICYHCGRDNHYTGECRSINSPQTSAGIEAWKKRNEKLGKSFDYDKNYYIEKQKEINARIAANDSSNNKNNNKRRNKSNLKSSNDNKNKNCTPSSQTASSSAPRVSFANNDSDSDD